MARARVVLDVEVVNGQTVVRGAKLSGGGGGSAASGGGGGSGGSGGQSSSGVATERASAFAGRPTAALSLTSLGYATRESFRALSDPTLSGAAQRAQVATQAARAAGYGAGAAIEATGDALSKVPGLGAVLKSFGSELKVVLGEALAAIAERAQAIKVQAAQASVDKVGGVVEQFSRAGLGGQVSDEDIKNLLARQEAAETRGLLGRERVAKVSGNIAVDPTQAFRERFGALADNSPELQAAFDAARQQSEQAAKGIRAVGGGNGGQVFGH